MSSLSPQPPLTSPLQLPDQLQTERWAVMDAAGLRDWCGFGPVAGQAWAPLWADLPPDEYLRDGGRYRRRRHGCCVLKLGGEVREVPHRAHWQPVEYNALHGGIERWFAPLVPALSADADFHRLLRGLGRAADVLHGPQTWFVETHQFRIDTTDGIGRPTPEGAHRDGVDLVAVLLVARHQVKGGETRVFDAQGTHGQRFTLAEPWSALLMDDWRVIHETTPIQPVEPSEPAWRDTLVVTLRRGAFQGPASA